MSRKVIEVNPRFQPDGKRFAVKDYPKDKEYRRFKISLQFARKIEAHVASAGLGPADLLFARQRESAPPRAIRILAVAYLDGWPARQRIWPWATALTGLGVSVAGNIGHVQPGPGHHVILADRLTAATSPIAAFAGLAIGLLVLKMTRQQASNLDTPAHQPTPAARPDRLHAVASVPDLVPAGSPAAPPDTGTARSPAPVKKAAARPGLRLAASAASRHDLLREAGLICQAAAANGERISQRALARQLRGHGHRSPTATCTASA